MDISNLITGVKLKQDVVIDGNIIRPSNYKEYIFEIIDGEALAVISDFYIEIGDIYGFSGFKLIEGVSTSEQTGIPAHELYRYKSLKVNAIAQ